MRIFTLRDSSESPSPTPISPAKDGTMREDKHWIIKIPRNAGFDHPYEAHCVVHPVISSEASFNVWKTAHATAAMFDNIGFTDRWVGRRVNDEVELFCEDGDTEYELLKQTLEDTGFIVRPYVQPTETKNRKVSRETIEGRGKNTLMSRITENFQEYIYNRELEKGVKVRYGIIADTPGPKKSLCIARVDEETFGHLRAEKGACIPARNQFEAPGGETEQWKIVGEITNSEAKFYCGDEETKSYFDSLGQIFNTAWQDFVMEKEQKEKEERRKEKRAAKKHRRMMTESTTATTPSEMSFGFRLAEEEEEVVKARQRAKQNEKRKKQKQRRRAETLEAAQGRSKHGTDSDDTKTDDSGKNVWTLIQTFQDHKVYQNNKGGLQARMNGGDSGIGSADEDEAEEVERKARVKLPKTQRQESKLETDASHEGQQIETVMVQSLEEARQYMHRPMMIAWPQEDGSDKRTTYSDLSYIGRGL